MRLHAFLSSNVSHKPLCVDLMWQFPLIFQFYTDLRAVNVPLTVAILRFFLIAYNNIIYSPSITLNVDCRVVMMELSIMGVLHYFLSSVKMHKCQNTASCPFFIVISPGFSFPSSSVHPQLFHRGVPLRGGLLYTKQH